MRPRCSAAVVARNEEALVGRCDERILIDVDSGHRLCRSAGWGTTERAMRVKETWRRFTPAQVKDFLRVGYEGREHPSRLRAIELLEGMTSVLDVGCGTGVMFELLRERRPDIDYLGIDVTAQFVAAARERFPADAARFQEGSLYELAKLPGVSDAVLCRHILEHLPDFEPAVQRMYERARRKLIVVFYLPPRPLRLRRKRDERFERGFYTHTYDSAASSTIC